MALCLGYTNGLYDTQFASTMHTGTIEVIAFPCDGDNDEPCPPCLTLALKQASDGQIYYLTTAQHRYNIQEQLDSIMHIAESANNSYKQWITVVGMVFWRGHNACIDVERIQTNNISSLCDEWNVWHESFESYGPVNFNQVVKYQLTTDTLINGQQYVKLTSDKDYPYCGAMREGTNADIYYVPSGSTHEYLLYAFNAQVGDTITNLYVGAMGKEEGYQAVVRAISDSNPRIFTVGVNIDEYTEYPIKWIEGVGSPETPCGLAVVPPSPADVGTYSLLCAYNKGEQVYVSEMGKQYGCEYNQTPLLPSICDEWNVLEISNVTCGYCEEYRTYNFHLTTDTVIGGLLYSQLIKDGAYKGALREGNNRDIYCVPAGCSQEYLLYAFNAQVGDSLKNIWVGGYSSWIPDVRSAIVSEIKQTTPRTIELEVHYYEAPDAYEESIRNLTWIEGIGMPFGPMGAECSVFNGCADSKAKLLLCAYKNGEHIYTSDFGEQYGCEYNDNPDSIPSDTIPLYIKDGPGSSTIEPVDPNEIIAKLIHDELQMKEYLHTIIDYNLTKAPAANSSPAVKHVNPVVAADSFTDSETVTLTESGRYFLEMSHPDWDYTIVGTFVYDALQGLETIENSQSACTKELREGQLLIRQGEQLYTPTGIRIQ